MSQSVLVSPSKKGYAASAAMSFVGMLAAVPVVMMLFTPGSPANASPNNGAASNYDQFAYAYTQGYLANAKTTNATMPGCGEGSVMPEGGMGTVGGFGSFGAAAVTPGAVAVAGVHGPVHEGMEPGRGNIGGGGNLSPEELQRVIRDSYNTYTYVYTNSNNSIGSNNTTSTSVAVSNSRNVDIDTANTTDINNDVKNIAISDSFNHDSHDTTTNTTNTSTAVNDSYNYQSGNAIAISKDSGNTVSNEENTTVNKTENENSGNTIVVSDNELTDNSHQNNSTNEVDDVNHTDTIQ